MPERIQLSTERGYHVNYGNTGCGVFKRGGTKLERFLPKNQQPLKVNFLSQKSSESF